MMAVLQTLENSPVRATDIKKWTAEDPLLSRVMDLVLHGGLGSQAHSVRPYGLYEHEVSVQDGCLLRGNRVVIPPAGRAAVLELLHEGHSGATRTKDLARSFVWWPGIEKESRRWSNDAIPANRQDTTHLQHLYIHGSFQTTLGNVYKQILPARCMEGRCS